MQAGKLFRNAFCLGSAPWSEKQNPNSSSGISINDKQTWKATLGNRRSLHESEYLPGLAPLPLPSPLRGIPTWQKRQLVCQMTRRNVTTGSKLMTLFLILLAGLIAMNIKLISSCHLNPHLPFPSLKSPDFGCRLYYLCTFSTNPCQSETLQ